MPAFSIALRLDDPLKAKHPGPDEYTLPAQQWDASNNGVSLKFRCAQYAGFIWKMYTQQRVACFARLGA